MLTGQNEANACALEGNDEGEGAVRCAGGCEHRQRPCPTSKRMRKLEGAGGTRRGEWARPDVKRPRVGSET